MSEVTLNLKKIKKQKSSKNKSLDNKFNGFKTLYLINLKRLIRNKAIIAMAILSLLVTLTMSTIVSKSMKNPEDASSLGIIIVSVQFICEVFFFIVFMIILSSELIKKQLLEGIQNIEIRSGMSRSKSFLLRFYVFITFTMALALANAVLKIALSTEVVFQFNALSLVILSTSLFFFFIGIVWTPVVFLITIICSIAWSVMLNIFITMILVMSGMFSSMDALLDNYKMDNYKMVQKTNLKLSIGNSFYQTLKNESDDSIKALFNDDDGEGNSLISKNLNKNLIDAKLNEENKYKFKSTSIYYLENIINNGGSSNSQEFIEIKKSFEASLYGGIFNVNYKNDKTSDIYKPLLNTSIYNVLNEIFETVEAGMKTDDNKPPLSLPGYNGGYMHEYGYDSKFHNISPLLNWIIKQPDTKKYKKLLNWVDSFYSKYKFVIPSNKYTYDKNKPFIFKSNFSDNNYFLNEDENKEIQKVYKRYPELMIINEIIAESWIASMVSRAELGYSGYNPGYGKEFKDANQTYAQYQEWTNQSIMKNNLNIFQHFSTIHSQLLGSNEVKDILFKDSLFGYTGLTTGYKNIEDLSVVDAREFKDDQPLTPVFEKVQLQKKSGFLVSVAMIIYLLIGTAGMYLIYLLWSRKSKI
ncbi:hypothetical protein [Spiroplasma endosymbiont of Diplazon laetatorius]|uniref:hypothetical protein n=1 Tax=Spiroplasma endosymbiont of Diplazon laetatorius TaxID=3066322 RepID=UPI0030D1B4F8